MPAPMLHAMYDPLLVQPPTNMYTKKVKICLFEQKLLQDGRAGELGIKQDAAKDNEPNTLAPCTGPT